MEPIQTIEKIKEEVILEQTIRKLAEEIYENVINFIDQNTNDDGMIYTNAIMKTKNNYIVDGNFLNVDRLYRDIHIKDTENSEYISIRKNFEDENRIKIYVYTKPYAEGENSISIRTVENEAGYHNEFPHIVIIPDFKHHLNSNGDIDEKIKKYVIDFFERMKEETKTLVYDSALTHREENENILVKMIQANREYTRLMHQYHVLPSVEKAAKCWSSLLIHDDEQAEVFQNEFKRLCMEEFDKNNGTFPINISTAVVWSDRFNPKREISTILQEAMQKAKIDYFIDETNDISMSIGIDYVKADKTIDLEPDIKYIEPIIDWHMSESNENDKRGVK